MWWSIASLVWAAIACGLLLYTRKLAKAMEKQGKDFQAYQEFYEWGVATRVVVRDKKNHADARRQTVWGMFETFRNGGAFENAMMLFQNTEFKVYAQGKKEE